MRILTFGTFDDFHPGHLSYLTQASALGELFIVIARDDNVLRIKGRAPLQTEEERRKIVKEAFPLATVVYGHPKDQKLPPGLTEEDLPCKVQRAEAFEPNTHKSSLRRTKEGL